tara:strand:- start:72 stop:206 length:135 start_codon:yes stop_codon:yes gene_type:complete
MDFKTKFKIIMKRKFHHNDLAMIGGAVLMIGSIVFMMFTQGVSV